MSENVKQPSDTGSVASHCYVALPDDAELIARNGCTPISGRGATVFSKAASGCGRLSGKTGLSGLCCLISHCHK